MNWQKIKPIVLNLEIVGLIVAIIAAVWHSNEIRQTAKELKRAEASLSKKIEDTNTTMALVQGSLSTRSLGTFPDFTDGIEKLLRSAKRDILSHATIPRMVNTMARD